MSDFNAKVQIELPPDMREFLAQIAQYCTFDSVDETCLHVTLIATDEWSGGRLAQRLQLKLNDLAGPGVIVRRTDGPYG